MEGLRERLKVGSSTKVGIEIIETGLPIAMIGSSFARVLGYVQSYRRDPNGREAHVLDVVEIVHGASPSPSTICSCLWIAGRSCGLVSARKSIGQDLIYRFAAPLRRCSSGLLEWLGGIERKAGMSRC